MSTQKFTKHHLMLYPSGMPEASSPANHSQDRKPPFETLLAAVSTAFLCLDHQWRIQYVYSQPIPVFQQASETLLGKQIWQVFPGALGSTFYSKYQQAGAAPLSLHFEAFYAPLSKWYEVLIYPSPDGRAVSVQDITAAKSLGEELFSLAAMIDSSEDAILRKTLDGRVLSWNDGARRLYGYAAHEIIGFSVERIVPVERRKEWRQIMQRLAAGERLEHFETVRRCKDGRMVDVSITISPVRDATGKIIEAATIARDIQERKQALERQRVLNEASAVLLSSLDHQITLPEIARLIVPAFADYCRIALVDEQHQIKELVFHHHDSEHLALVQDLYESYKDRAAPTYGLHKLLRTGEAELLSDVATGAQEAIQRSPELRSLLQALGLRSYMGIPLLIHDKIIGAITFSSVQPHRFYTSDDLAFAQELAHRIAFVLENARLRQEAENEIAVRKQAQEQQQLLQERILALATTDAVTTLPNHRALIALLEQELERAHRYKRCCSLLFLDLDHFKALNDGYGHIAGDSVLCECAGVVQGRLRRMDTLGRWGGEEFVAILPEMTADEALALAEDVRAAVATHLFRGGGGLHLTCSIGMASFPLHAQARESLVVAADHAMYGAKRFGRNQVRVANDPAVQALFTVNPPDGGREEDALVGMAEALVTLVEARDHATGRHSHQATHLVLQLALSLGVPATEAQMLALAGRLHDVGKVAVPDEVLQKPGHLSEQEWQLMRIHPVVGAEVVSYIPALRPLAPVIRAHHERWDGQGYPDHLQGEAIPFGARILAVADAYLAMTEERPYQHACGQAAALAELRRCAGSQFDEQVVEAFARLVQSSDQRESAR